jgi:uncharacterized protein YjiS (DUF1127 family)
MRNAAYFIASQRSDVGDGLLQSALRGIQQALKAWKSRRQVASLADFDDHMLGDLGLSRGDVLEALRLPFGSDPGRELQFRASRNIRRGWNV